MRRLFPLIACLMMAAAATAAEAPQQSSGSESLGGGLLDDLPGSPQEQSRPARRQTPATLPLNPRAAASQLGLPLQPLRFDDVGPQANAQPTGPMLLVRAGQGMTQAESLLKKPATLAQAGDAQQQVVKQLDELIAELSKQCNCSGGAPSNKPPSPSQRSQAKPGKSGNTPGRGNAPARDSNSQLTGSAERSADEQADREELAKRLWGHLPEREREQMLQSFSEEFLPKYELEIERYYLRLSEEQE